MGRSSWLAIILALSACNAEPATPYAPSGSTGTRDSDASDESASDEGDTQDDDSPATTSMDAAASDGAGTGGGSAPDMRSDASTDEPAPLDPASGTMLVEAKREDAFLCFLQALGPHDVGRATTDFPCSDHSHMFRRSDGARHFVRDGAVYRSDLGGAESLVETACEVVGRIDFDASDRLYYRCSGGTTAPMYRDDTLVVEDVVAEFGGALDDGHIVFHAFEEFAVLDGDGTEVARYETPFGWTALEDSTTIVGNQAFVLFVDDGSGGEPVYVVMKYEAGAWTEVVRHTPVEPPPSNFGNGLRLAPDGALYVALDGMVRRYAPDGSSEVVWMASDVVSVSTFDELVYNP